MGTFDKQGLYVLHLGLNLFRLAILPGDQTQLDSLAEYLKEEIEILYSDIVS